MFTLNCKGRLLEVNGPLVMGIINATPDSFYESSRFSDSDKILEQASTMLNEGADIIDIGGQTTKPGSKPISEKEELQRVIPGIEVIHREFPGAIISIDTFYAGVAKEAVAAGASMVNDISAGNFDKGMIPLVATLKTPYIIMHMQGVPQTMQQDPFYENVTRSVLDFFITKKEECRQAGIYDLIIDPGFGFGKTIRHNFELLKNLSILKMLDEPLLIGLSRKSTIYKTLNITIDEALNGTTVLNTMALMNGADILRVHDVKEACEAVKLWSSVNRESSIVNRQS